MILKFFFLSFLLICLAGVFADESDVLQLTDDDFDSTLSQFETSLVMFYAPWCGHCKRLKPDFEKAAQILSKNDPPITLVKVDCTESGKSTCNNHGVSGYPTVKIFRYGKFVKEYTGPRNADGIVKYMKAQVGPGSKVISSVEDFNKVTSKDDVVIVGFFKKDSDLKSTFMNLADKLREKVAFAHTTEESVLSAANVKSEGIRLYRPKVLANKFESSEIDFTGSNALFELEAWVKENYHGLAGHRTTENTEDFKAPLVVAYFNVDYVKNPKGTNYWRNRVLKVAKQFKDKFSFAVSAKDDFQHELNEFGFDYVPSEKPLICARDANKQKFVMKDEFSIENLEKFMQELSEGKLSPYLKSEDVPADNSAPVKVAVAKNFDEVVANNGKDTLIEFYAPWCGHCKKLVPIYDELGEKLKDENVAIVKMDATANDVPAGFDVRGFPTLYWVPKDSKNKPVRYEGGRELDDFIKYIAAHATEELKGYDRSGNAKAAAKEEL
ncbi:hypothetical protein V9T40_013381 [Parthenolecanium corni]|uniref:Protein disulfide-isomerase n=1 Tax=Parthenolecanium corni TaxID=536013 RepID=A0AAN9TNE7_9HEMI